MGRREKGFSRQIVRSREITPQSDASPCRWAGLAISLLAEGDIYRWIVSSGLFVEKR